MHALTSVRRVGKSFLARLILQAAIAKRHDVQPIAPVVCEQKPEVRGPGWSHEEKALAYNLDPDCWISYSGKNREFKRAMDKRRLASLRKAVDELQARI